MIDLHCHILPEIDDGPKSLVDAISMALAAESTGITHIFATPHHLNERYENTKHEILQQVEIFNRLLRQENIEILIHPGQELRIHHELLSLLEKDEILTLDNLGKYLLLEIPPFQIPTYTKDIVYELLLKGITPIIVHPEKNITFIEKPNLLFDLVHEGALTQVTSGSITGEFGKRAKTFSEEMIEHHLVHFIATDAHNLHKRRFTLKEAYEEITRKFGCQQTDYLRNNAEMLLLQQSLHIQQPKQIRKRLFGIF